MIKRKLLKNIENELFKRKAIILIGPRQVGKTTLVDSLAKKHKNKTLFLNCDEPETRESLTNTNTTKLKLLIKDTKLLIIDEAQRVDNIGLTLKLIVDNFKDVQVVATGSSAFELRNKLNEPLTGRKIEYRLYPISSGEIIDTQNIIEEKKSLETRLIYGSYPDIFNNPQKARNYLLELCQSYLYKDIFAVNEIRKPAIIENLLKALAFQVGSEVSINELSKTLQTDNKTIERYIDLLEKCYVIFRLNGLSRNLRSELKKNKKIYFYDNGVRNAIIQNFAPPQMRNDMGALWENFFITERMKHNHYSENFCNSYFWRTTQQQEIDLVEESDGSMTIFEIKWNSNRKVSFPKTFLANYPVKDSIVITPENYIDYLI